MVTDNPDPEDEHGSFMDLALELADQAAREDEVPVGAVVVLDGRVIGRGSNRSITDRDPTAHAEIRAMREASRRSGNYRLTGATLYVTLEPCPMCAGAMVHARLARLVFGCADSRGGGAVSLYRIPTDPRLNHQIQVVEGVRRGECSRRLQAFFRARRTRSES
jgi:tRNA(adenine34) deaminase